MGQENMEKRGKESRGKLEPVFKEQKTLLAVFFRGVDLSRKTKISKDTFYFLFNDDYPLPALEPLAKTVREHTKDNVAVEFVNPKDEKEKHDIFLNAKLVYTTDYSKTKEYVDDIVRFEYGVQNVRKVDPRSTRELVSENEHLGDKVLALYDKRNLYVFVGVVMAVIAGVLTLKSRGLEINIFNGVIALIFWGIIIAAGWYLYYVLANLYLSRTGSRYEEGYSQAKAYIFKKQYNKAILEYRKAIQQDPADYEPHYRLAELLEFLGHYESAVVELQLALKKTGLKEVEGHILHHLAEIYFEKIKDAVKAKHYLNKVAREYGDTKAGERARMQLEKIP